VRPWLLVDVDFTLNPDLSAVWDAEEGDRLRAAGWAVLQGFTMNARPVWLNIWHGRDLLRVAYETGAELAWATRWHQLANQVLSPVMGLPQIPVAPCDPHQEKPVTVIPWTQGRPFVWLDDEDAVVALSTAAPGGFAVKVNPETGLTDANLQEAAALLERMATKRAA
jgi:hypothetical protein